MSKEPPKIRSPLKVNDAVIGEITINPDGSFEGRIKDRLTHALWVAYLVEGLGDGMALHPYMKPAIESRETIVGRNAFENNAQEVPLADLASLADKLCMTLPPLAEGNRYDLVKLSNGRVAVTVEKD